jgi:hypothetical protein
MPSNNPSNNVKHKINGFDVAFTKSINKWQVKKDGVVVFDGNFKQCKTYCKKSSNG